MKKEVILAILIGFAVGLTITFGIWTANKSLRQAATTKPTPNSSPLAEGPSPAPAPSSQLSLTLDSPSDELLTNNNVLTISGKTSPSATIVIFTETEEKITTSSATGNFSAEVELEGGYNQLRIVVFDNSGNSTEQKLLVTYSTSKI